MFISSSSTPNASPVRHSTSPAPIFSPPLPARVADTFHRSVEPDAQLSKLAKWSLAAGTTIGASALGHYAGSQAGILPGAAGAVVGALVGVVGLGGAGLVADIASLGGKKAVPFAIAGGVLGSATGAVLGAFFMGSGTTMAMAGGIAALAATAAATDLLHS